MRGAHDIRHDLRADLDDDTRTAPLLIGGLLVMVLVVAVLAVAVPASAAESSVASVEPQTQAQTSSPTIQTQTPQPKQADATPVQDAKHTARKAKAAVIAKAHAAQSAVKAGAHKAKTDAKKVLHKAKAAGDNAQVGMASYYAKHFNKKKTASGEKFSSNLPTAAHRTLPIGTHVKVTNLQTGQSTTVRVNDRGPFKKGRVIDLSPSAAKDIGMTHDGVAPVKIEVVGHDDKEAPPAANNATVKQEAAAQKTAPADQTAAMSAKPAATEVAEAAETVQPSAAQPAAQPKPVAAESDTKSWQPHPGRRW